MEENLRQALARHPKCDPPVRRYVYGTSGFRTRAEDLDPVLFRMGVLAAVRSVRLRQVTGLMVTASHNPIQDNGVKQIDPDGEMMKQDWEPVATLVANCPDVDFVRVIKELLALFDQKLEDLERSVVVLGRDTRPSSDGLAAAVRDAIAAVGGTCLDMGYTTTPQLHLIVQVRNISPELAETFTADWYVRQAADKFLALYAKGSDQSSPTSGTLHVDCANGVGGPVMQKILPLIEGVIAMKLHNTGEGILNHECGADFVKTNQKCPPRLDPLVPNDRYAAFDGDADRIVYFFKDSSTGSFVLLDGDRIAILYAVYVKRCLATLQLDSDLDMCLVQTAYANGSSTRFIADQLKPFRTVCTETGVKHLAEAAKKSDLGIFFEANGHGTIFYSDILRLRLSLLDKSSLSDDKKAALDDLQLIGQLINQATGDAITDLLVVEVILKRLNWTLADWNALYADLPSVLVKLSVPDRLQLQTTDAARKVIKPVGLQEQLDQLVATFGPSGRSFVRPSGTEDVVRVYAEASTPEDAQRLADQVSALVLKHLQ